MPDRRGLYALVAANSVSQLGNVVALVALPWFVLETTGSPARAGLTAFATTVPLALGAIVGAPLVDRIGTRRASVAADLGAAAAIASIPLLHSLDALAFWNLLVLAFAAGAFEAPGRAARRAMFPDLAAAGGMELERANSIATTSEHTGYVLGAPLAGILIAGLGAPNALWLDAASFVLSAALVAGWVPTVRAAIGRTRMLDGLRFVRRAPLLRTFFVIWTVGAFLIGPLAAVVLPVYAREELGGSGSLAAAVTAYGLGGLAGTLAFFAFGTAVSRRSFFVAIWVVYPAVSFALVAVPPLVVLLPLLFGVGALAGAYDPFEATIHQEQTPPELRARAFAILLAAEMMVVPVAMLAYGLLLETAGLRAGLLLFAFGNALLGAYAIASRTTRRLEPATAEP